MAKQVRLVSPGSKLVVSPGDYIRVDIEFTYQGPAWRETLYGALYGRTLGMIDEVSGGAGASSVDVPATYVPGIVQAYVLVPVPNRPGETFGIYAKLGNILSRFWDSVIEIAEEAPPPPPPGQCPLSVYVSPSSGGSVTISPAKALYDDGEMIDIIAIPNPGWYFVEFTGDGWVTSANPVHVRGCRTTSVTAHFI